MSEGRSQTDGNVPRPKPARGKGKILRLLLGLGLNVPVETHLCLLSFASLGCKKYGSKNRIQPFCQQVLCAPLIYVLEQTNAALPLLQKRRLYRLFPTLDMIQKG